MYIIIIRVLAVGRVLVTGLCQPGCKVDDSKTAASPSSSPRVSRMYWQNSLLTMAFVNYCKLARYMQCRVAMLYGFEYCVDE